MQMHFATCRPDQSVLRLAGWLLACLLAHTCGVECAQQCIGEPVLEPHLISLISAGTGTGTGTKTKDQERNTALCAHPLHLSLRALHDG